MTKLPRLLKRTCLVMTIMVSGSVTAAAQSCDHVDGAAGDMVAYIFSLSEKNISDPKMTAQALLLWNAHGVDGLDKNAVTRGLVKSCFTKYKDCGSDIINEAIANEIRRPSILSTSYLNRSIVPEKPPAAMVDWAKQTIGGCAMGAGGGGISANVVETRPLAQCERWVKAVEYNGRDMSNSGFKNFFLRWDRATSTMAKRRVCNAADLNTVQWAQREVRWMDEGLQRLEQQRRDAAAARARQQAVASTSTQPTQPREATVDEIFDSWFKTHQRWVDCERKHGSCRYVK